MNLVRASNPQDEVFVVNFSDEYFLDQPFTSKINLLQGALEKYETRGEPPCTTQSSPRPRS